MARLRLEEFSQSAPPMDDQAVEEDPIRLAAFEEGYAAGWEDAVSAQASADASTKADVETALRGLANQMQESRANVLAALEPLFSEICTRLLPEIARHAVAPAAADALMPLAEGLIDKPVRLRVAPAARGAVDAYLAQIGTATFDVIEDPALGPGQVEIATDRVEAHVDLDAATASVVRSIRSFFDTQQMERQDAQ